MPSGREPFQPEKRTQVASPRKIIMGMPAICWSLQATLACAWGVERFFIVMLQRVVWRYSSDPPRRCRLAGLQSHIKTLKP
ncbi:hypothetical protein D3C80_2053810 [compost metagenome]